MTSSLDNMSDILSILGIGIGIIMAIFGIWLSSHLQKKGIIKNSINAIKTDLKDTKLGFEEDKKFTFIKNGEHYYIMTIFNTGAYDSVVHSGYFIQLEEELQISLNEIYNRIKLNNDTIRYIETLEDKYALGVNTNLENFEKAHARYKERLVVLQQGVKAREGRNEIEGIEKRVNKVLETLAKKQDKD